MATLAEARAALPGSGCAGTVTAPLLESDAHATVRPGAGLISAFYEISLGPFDALVARVPLILVLEPTIRAALALRGSYEHLPARSSSRQCAQKRPVRDSTN